MDVNHILATIDQEINLLEQARKLLAASSAVSSSSDLKPAKLGRKRRRLSAAARKKIADAQRLRWAKQKKAAQKD